ncbi:MAG: FAD-binding oxidoreductase [Vicinamibacterales bacterium]
MPSHRIRARDARGDTASAVWKLDDDIVASYLTDAARVPGGHAKGVAAPASEAAVASLLRSTRHVLAIGAQSSLTGGATPRGETILTTARMNAIVAIAADSVRVQAGVTLDALDQALAAAGRSYPPVPTFTGAFVGGIVATNAAGAATFKYGSTRDWVTALTVVLPGGRVLDLERGSTVAHPDGYFEIDLGEKTVRVPIPTYRMPDVSKISAGYFAAPGMDLIDLFIGSEGTLGVVTEATLRVLRARPAVCRAFVPFHDKASAFDVVSRLRAEADTAWSSGGSRGIDVSAIEHIDARGLAVIREDGMDNACGVRLSESTKMALIVALDLPPGTTPEAAFHQIGRAGEADAPDTGLVRFCALLAGCGVLDDVEIAVPGDSSRLSQLAAIREAVPAGVNQRITAAQHDVDRRIEKTAGDLLVRPADVEAFAGMCEDEFRDRGLDFAVWGHVSDGNLHPNVIPHSWSDVEAGRDALFALGREAIRLGGVPLAEHGVGRNTIKQRLLLELYGNEGVEQMREVKRAIDPDWKLSPGVIFPP